jgi:hypothetical protein
MRIATIIALGLALLMGTARDGSACSRARPVPTSQALVREASLIMLVRAMPTRLSNMVEFLVIETIKGESIGSSIVLEGTLVARGDYNDSPFPYTFVRAQGAKRQLLRQDVLRGRVLHAALEENERRRAQRAVVLRAGVHAVLGGVGADERTGAGA